MAGVSSRTRSRNATHHCSLNGSSSSSSKRRKRGASAESVRELIVIHDADDYDDHDDNSNGEEEDEERLDLEHSVKKKDEEESDVIVVDKGENFGEENECGLKNQNPITIDSDGSDDSSSTDETSDEGYEAGDVENESSNDDDDDEEDDDDDDDDDDDVGKKNLHKYRKVVEEMLRKAKTESSGNRTKSLKHADHASSASGVSSNTFEKKDSFQMKGCSSKMYEESAEKLKKAKNLKRKQVENVSGGGGDDDEVLVIGDDDDGKKNFHKHRKVVEEMLRKAKIESSGNHTKSGETKRKRKEEELDECTKIQENLKHADHASASMSSNTFEKKKGSFETKGCSSKMYESAEKKQKAKRVKNQVENVSDDDDEVLVIGESRQSCDFPRTFETHKDAKKKMHSFRGQQSVPPVLGVTGDSTKVEKSKRNTANANVNGKDCKETLLWSFADKVEPLQRSKSEEELVKLWEEVETYCKPN